MKSAPSNTSKQTIPQYVCVFNSPRGFSNEYTKVYYDTSIEQDLALLYLYWQSSKCKDPRRSDWQDLRLIDATDDPTALYEIGDRGWREHEFEMPNGRCLIDHLEILEDDRPGTIAGLATAARKLIEEYFSE